MFDNVKSRLGFGGQQQPERRSSRVNDEFYDDGYDDYDGYDDGYDYYDDGYDDGANGYPDYVGAEPSSQYDRYSPVTTRTSAGVSPARLVSIDDVRASTHMPASLDRDPLPARRSTPTSSSFRTLVNESTPAPNSPADVSRRRERSESLDDLFEPTTDAGVRSSRAGLGASPLASTASSSFEQRDSFAAASASRTRNVKVLHPLAYGDVEQVVKILRAGDAVVLAFDATPADLTKRLLDFSFGVACAMSATVDSLSPKVFFIAAGPALTEVERMHLRSQGVL